MRQPKRSITTLLAVAALLFSGGFVGANDSWTPADWVDEEVIELGTTEPGEDLHWFKVWLVVIDGDVYVRLGSAASERFEESTTKPYLGVKIAGKEFAKVEGVVAPDKVEQVANLMADKYWSDIFVAWIDHPLTLRLKPTD